MPTPVAQGRISPSTGNLLVGKGFMIFKLAGDDTFFHLGNCPQLTITPKVTNLDHFDSQQGTKTKDLTIVTEKSMEMKVQMEEFTARNLSLLLLGDVDDTDPDQPIVNLFTAASKEGHFKFFAANDVGPRWYVDLPSVTFNPSGDWSPISDNFANMEATATVNSVSGVWGTATLQPPIDTIEPENLLEPFIDGVAKNGNTLVAYVGGWVAVDAFAYQWNNNGTPIYGATESTYTLVIGDVGDTITVTVTASNGNGDTPVTSAGVGPVAS